MKSIRIVAGVVLAGLLVFYTWFAFRDDARLMTVPGVPQAVWFYFDHHANIRNGVGFLILGAVGAAAVAGLDGRWQMVSVVLCLAAPLLKDLAQELFAPTRHFNWDATGVGMAGSVIGWFFSAGMVFYFRQALRDRPQTGLAGICERSTTEDSELRKKT